MHCVSIAELTPELPARESKQFRAVVTLIWPYSSSARQFTLLLADPDIHQRRRYGHVRVRFSGSSAKAVANTHVSIGDELVLSLHGVEFLRAGAFGTSGKVIDWELCYAQTIHAQILRHGEELANVELANVTPTPAATSPVRSPARRIVDNPHQWTSPAFLKQSRLADGPIFEAGYDPFTDDIESKHDRKRRRRSYRDWNAWTYYTRAPSPEKEDMSMDEYVGADASPIPVGRLPDTPVSPPRPQPQIAPVTAFPSDQEPALEGDEDNERDSNKGEVMNTEFRPENLGSSEVNDEFVRDADYYDLYAGPDEIRPIELRSVQNISSDEKELVEVEHTQNGPITQSNADVFDNLDYSISISGSAVVLSDNEASDAVAKYSTSAGISGLADSEAEQTAADNVELPLSGMSSEQLDPHMELGDFLTSPQTAMPPPTLPLLQTDLQIIPLSGFLTPVGNEPSSPNLRPLDSSTLPMPSPFPGEKEENITSYLEYSGLSQQGPREDLELRPEAEAEYIVESSFYSSVSSSNAPAFHPTHESAFTDIRFTFGMDGSTLSHLQTKIQEDEQKDNESDSHESCQVDRVMNTKENLKTSDSITESIAEADSPLQKATDNATTPHETPITLRFSQPDMTEVIDLLSNSDSENVNHKLGSVFQDNSQSHWDESKVRTLADEERYSRVFHDPEQDHTYSLAPNRHPEHDLQQLNETIDDEEVAHYTLSNSSVHSFAIATEVADRLSPERNTINVPASKMKESTHPTDRNENRPDLGSSLDMDDAVTLLNDDAFDQKMDPVHIQPEFHLVTSPHIQFDEYNTTEPNQEPFEDVEPMMGYEVQETSAKTEHDASAKQQDIKLESIEESSFSLQQKTVDVGEEDVHQQQGESFTPEQTPELLIAVPNEGSRVGQMHIVSVPASGPSRNTRSRTKLSTSPNDDRTGTPSRKLRSRTKASQTTRSPSATASRSTVSPTRLSFSTSPYSLRSHSKTISPKKAVTSVSRLVKHSDHPIDAKASTSVEPSQQSSFTDRDSYRTDYLDLSNMGFEPSQELGTSYGKFTNVAYIKDSEEGSLHSEGSLSTMQYSDDSQIGIQKYTNSSNPINFPIEAYSPYGSQRPANEEYILPVEESFPAKNLSAREEVDDLRSSPPTPVQSTKRPLKASKIPMTPEASQQTSTESQTVDFVLQNRALPMTPQLTQSTSEAFRSFALNERDATEAETEPQLHVDRVGTSRKSVDADTASSPATLDARSGIQDQVKKGKQKLPTIGLSTPLSYYTPLKDLRFFLNRSSSFHAASNPDVFGLVTTASVAPTRATKGPKHYTTTLHITDISIYPSQTTVQLFRPYEDALPIAAEGDVILLRAFGVRSLNRHPCLVSADESAWCVWRYSKPLYGKKRGTYGEMQEREEIRGPAVERGDGEREEVGKLRSWYLSTVKAGLDEKEREIKTRSKGKVQTQGNEVSED